MRRFDDDHGRSGIDTADTADTGGTADGAPGGEAETSANWDSSGDSEADILRSELTAAGEKLASALAETAALSERYVRTRAEFDTYRRRMVDELSMAREAGLDSALLPVLTVFDDLGRALDAAGQAADAGSIVPGVRVVHENLLRALEGLGVRQVGAVGEAFDPHFHEAVAAMPPANREQAGSIMVVHRTGFAKGERVIRPATVTVYQE